MQNVAYIAIYVFIFEYVRVLVQNFL